MKPPVDAKFWNDRARQPDCLSLIMFNNSMRSAILPFDDVNHEKLIIKLQERIQREKRI
jgi:hypothetical protein